MKATVAVIAAIIAVVALLFVATEQTAPPEVTDAEIAQVEAEVRQTINHRWAAYQDVLVAGDIDGIMSYWTSDTRILEPGMDLTLSGARSFITDFFESGGEGFGFQPETFDLFVHGDVAYHIGQYDEDIQFGGQDRMVVQNYFFARWEKEADGVWRISRFVAAPRDAPEEG